MTATPSAGDVDLKTYDVPDPPKQGGWVLRCLLATALGLALAGGFVHAVRLQHLAWVAEHHPQSRWYRGPHDLGFVQQRAIRWLRDGWDADALLPVALGIGDPRVRGAFHAALVGSGDPAQVDAMLAYARTIDGYAVERELPPVLDSMFALDRARAAAAVLACYDAPGEPKDHAVGGEAFTRAIAEAAETRLTPEEALPFALGLEEPKRRGRFHRALATTKDPAHLDAILAYARTVIPTDPDARRPDVWAPLVESLTAFGAAATPKLEAVLEQTESRPLVSLAAEVLRASDLPFIVRRARALLDEYDAGVPRLAAAAQLVNAVEEGELEDADPTQVAAARALLREGSARAFMIFEVLRALEPIRGDEAVDFCIVRGLSTFDQKIAEWSALRCKERFTPDQLVDTLFRFMAQKTQFKVSEVDVYEGLLTELGAPGAARVATNLERLLREAGGDPEAVFWLYKKMGFKLLGELGGPDALPVLREYARDPGGYTLSTVITDRQGNKRREEQERRYADEVRAAVEAIEARAGGN